MWGRRRADPVELVAESVVRVPGPQERIWELLHRPESAVALVPGVVDAWREPGTPVGVGEVQVYVRLDDGVQTSSRNEVVLYEPGRRAVAELLEHELPGRTFVETVVASDASSDEVDVTHRCRLVLTGRQSTSYLARCQEQLDEWANDLSARLPEYCRPS